MDANLPDWLTRAADKLRMGHMGQDREEGIYRNKAIPNNALLVYQWPAMFEYMWSPAPSPEYPIHNAPDAANYRATLAYKGWMYWPAADFGSGEDDRPHLGITVDWEDDKGRVRALGGYWLLYRDRDNEKQRRQANIDQFNARRRKSERQASERDTFLDTEVKEEQKTIRQILDEETEAASRRTRKK